MPSLRGRHQRQGEFIDLIQQVGLVARLLGDLSTDLGERVEQGLSLLHSTQAGPESNSPSLAYSINLVWISRMTSVTASLLAPGLAEIMPLMSFTVRSIASFCSWERPPLSATTFSAFTLLR